MAAPADREVITLRPQPGPQEAFLASPADIAIYGGAAFSGKSWALLAEALRNVHNSNFGWVIFRRTYTQVTNEGGLWDESEKMFPLVGAIPKESALEWNFSSGATGHFAHLQHENNKLDWQGSQIPYIGFDELTHFTRGQFFYMLSRNRSTCGVRPYIRGTCNPDPDSFVAELIAWWIDPDSGYPIPERSGVLRYFLRDGDRLVWADTRDQLAEQYPDRDAAHDIKSLTFVAGSIEDNAIGMALDPAYRGNLMALPRVERERLLFGNWKVRPTAGMYFRRSYFEIVDALPICVRHVRAWDLAATEPREGEDPDWTAGVRMEVDAAGTYYVRHVEHFQGTPRRVEDAIKNTATVDGRGVIVSIPQDPGQAGKDQAQRYVRLLAGHQVKTHPVTGDKVTRAGGLSAQAEAGNVKLLRGPWNETFLSELESFPDGHDDQVDAAADAFALLTGVGRVSQGKLSGV